MVAVSLDEYMTIGDGDEEQRQTIQHYVNLKLSGTTCLVCGQPIWALGSGLIDSPMCFTCITGEADHSDDYEIFEVCWT